MVKALRDRAGAAAAWTRSLSLPNGGVVTKANASQFTAEWPG